MSKYLQPEELTLLLIRLRRHQAKLASIRNYTIAQLLQHLPTNSTYQVSCCLVHLYRMTFCDSANASSVACLGLCFLAHSLVFCNAQIICSFSLLFLLSEISIWIYRVPVHMFQSVMYTSSLYYFWKCCIFRNVCYKIRYAHSTAKPFLRAAFMVRLAPCTMCCHTCKLKCISQFVSSYDLVTISSAGEHYLIKIRGHLEPWTVLLIALMYETWMWDETNVFEEHIGLY